MSETPNYPPIKRRVVIRGSKWARGGKNGVSALLNSDGYRCCLGFDAKACGIPDTYMRGVSTPADLLPVLPFDSAYKVWLNEHGNNMATCLAMLVNDSLNYDDLEHYRPELRQLNIPWTDITSDEDRIARLRPLFRSVGVVIVWRPDL